MNKNSNIYLAYMFGFLTCFDSYFLVKDVIDWSIKDAFVKEERTLSTESELSDKVRVYIQEVEKEADHDKWLGLMNVVTLTFFGPLTIKYASERTKNE